MATNQPAGISDPENGVVRHGVLDATENCVGIVSMFEPAPLLRNVRLAFVAGFRIQRNAHGRTTPARGRWPAGWTAELCDFVIAETFLNSEQKQMFLRGRQLIKSWPPERAQAPGSLKLTLALTSRELLFEFGVYTAYFKDQRIIVAIAQSKQFDITLDDLIFVKNAKWHNCGKDAGPHWLKVTDSGACGVSYYHCMAAFLIERGLPLDTSEPWPLFDFIELRDRGPARGGGPNACAPLSIAQHWGLLCGDEGYRLIDESEPKYTQALQNEEWRLRNRRDWLYNFIATSCLAFVDPRIESHRRLWEEFYSRRLCQLKSVTDYVGFNPDIIGLQDGIPLIVEVCLLRYAQLRNVLEILKPMKRRAPLKRIRVAIQSIVGYSPLELTVRTLNELDLYKESGLWLSGGAYTERLYNYRSIYQTLNTMIDESKTLSADKRSFFMNVVMVLLTIIVVLLGVIADKNSLSWLFPIIRSRMHTASSFLQGILEMSRHLPSFR